MVSDSKSVKYDDNGALKGDLHDQYAEDSDQVELSSTTATLLYSRADGKDFWVVGLELDTDETTGSHIDIFNATSIATCTAANRRGSYAVPTEANLLTDPSRGQIDRKPGASFTSQCWGQLSRITAGLTRNVRVRVIVVVDPGIID